MNRKLTRSLTSRTAIASVNVLLVLLLMQGISEILAGFPANAATQHGQEEILEGLGTILVAVGVALEERETLLKFMKVYPQDHTPLQAEVDHHCHGYGLLVLLAGLFAEVAVYIVRMPNLDTVNIDPHLLLTGAGFCALGALLLARLSWALMRATGDLPQGA